MDSTPPADQDTSNDKTETKRIRDAVYTKLNQIEPEDAKQLYPKLKESLDAVEGLTQYEDGKAGRILTVVALLTALIGAFYGNVVRQCEMLADAHPKAWGWFQILFIAYCFTTFLSTAAVLVAIFPWFKIPFRWKSKTQNEVRTRFFAVEIAKTSEYAWASYFLSPPKQIEKDYCIDCIHEVHLISTKIARKFVILKIAGIGLILAGIVFLIWFSISAYLLLQ